MTEPCKAKNSRVNNISCILSQPIQQLNIKQAGGNQHQLENIFFIE